MLFVGLTACIAVGMVAALLLLDVMIVQPILRGHHEECRLYRFTIATQKRHIATLEHRGTPYRTETVRAARTLPAELDQLLVDDHNGSRKAPMLEVVR